MHSINNYKDGRKLSSQARMLSNCSVEKMQGWGFANMLTFAFMHHPYLVGILFGMPSLHLLTFLMFLFSCFYTFLMFNLKIDVNLRYS